MGYDGVVVAAILLSVALAEPVDASALELRMFELVNVERETRGLEKLSWSPTLAGIARDYSRQMASAKEARHGLDRTIEERIRSVRPGACGFGENVSRHTNIDYSLGDLMLSPGHRGNLLSPRFTEVGIGIVPDDDGFLYITQEFASPCPPPRKR